MSPESEQKTRRLFFALWPDPALQRQMAALAEEARRAGGRPVREENLHVTLAFLGNVTEGQLACLRRGLSDVQGRAFTLMLDRLGGFRRSGITWLGATEVPEALTALVVQIGQLMEACGLAPDTRPYQPHVTLRRRSRRSPGQPPFTPLRWPVAEFVLIESHISGDGARYEVLERLALLPSRDGAPPEQA